MSKQRKLFAIDQAATFTGGGVLDSASADVAPPAIGYIPKPYDLQLSPSLSRTDLNATALISATWHAPDGVTVEGYQIQVATDSAFTQNVIGRNAPTSSASIDGLKPNTLYYVQVRAAYSAVYSDWSTAASTTTPSDTTPPSPVTGATGTFQNNGDMILKWTNPPELNFSYVQIKIYASNGGATYATYQSTPPSFVWSLSMNQKDSSSTGDPSVYVELRSVSGAGFQSSAVALTVTKAVPSTPTGIGTDFAGPDAIWTWNAVSDAVNYRLQIDALARTVYTTNFTYTFDVNRSEHAGTPDPVLTWSLSAVDAFGQASTAATGTLTNPAPSAPSSVTIFGYFATFSISTVATLPTDFDHFLYRIIEDGTTIQTYTSKSKDDVFTTTDSGYHTYQVGVKVVDMFNQASTETLSNSISMDALTIEELRADADYTDSAGTASATLDNLKDTDSSTGVTYPGVNTWTNWTEFVRPLDDRYKTITICVTGLGVAQSITGAIVLYDDAGGVVGYYGGPLTSVNGRLTLAAMANLTNAEASPFTIPVTTATAIDLVNITQTRRIRLYHNSNTIHSYVLSYYYPRRLVQSDDIQAETIEAINIAAGTITGDRIAANTITGNLITGNAIDGKTITGALIQTSASNPRVALDSTGLKTYDSSGVLQVQATTGTTGQFQAGAGAIILDKNGLSIAQSLTGATSKIKWVDTSNTYTAGYSTEIYADSSAIGGGVYAGAVHFIAHTSNNSATASMYLDTLTIGLHVQQALYADSLNAGNISNIAGSGQLKVRSSAYIGNDVAFDANIRTLIYGPGTTSGTRGLRVSDSGGTINLDVYDDGEVTIRGNTAVGGSTISTVRLTAIGVDTSTSNYALVCRDSAASDLLRVRNDGQCLIRASTWTYNSDARLKENVGILGYGLAAILQFKPTSYDFIEGEKNQLGFMAQDIQQIVPEMVVEDPVDGTLGLQLNGMFPILVNAIQELNATNENQTARIMTLEADMQAVKDENIAMKQRLDQIEAQLTQLLQG